MGLMSPPPSPTTTTPEKFWCPRPLHSCTILFSPLHSDLHLDCVSLLEGQCPLFRSGLYSVTTQALPHMLPPSIREGLV